MVITLPEGLQKAAGTLAEREGINLETLVIQAVEHFLHQQQSPNPRAEEAHRRLHGYNKLKKKSDVDLVTEVRRAKAWASELYWGEEELRESQLLQLAEQPADYDDDNITNNETIS